LSFIDYELHRVFLKFKKTCGMKNLTLLLAVLGVVHLGNTQSVGIGTTNPNVNSSLDLGNAGKPLVIPRMTSVQMATINNSSLNVGMIIYNSTENQFYGHMRYRSSNIIGQSNYKWQPISTGPQMVAWGVVDSFGTEINGSGNYSVVWDATNNWYTLTVTSQPYYKDSMILLITVVGNGSWDQAIATGELVESTTRRASIKFIDISRSILGWAELDKRRRSNFHFVLYNLRKDPFDLLLP
jgi:hypothetical protein